jgi:hypothetical protein
MARVSRRILPYLREQILLVRFPGTDAYQEPLAATPPVDVVSGRLEYGRRKITDATGQEVVSEGLLFLAPGVEVGMRDMVRHHGRDWRVLRVDVLADLHGRASHVEVYLV